MGPWNTCQFCFWHPCVPKRVKKHKLSSGSVGVQIRVKTYQNPVFQDYFLTLVLQCERCASSCQNVSKKMRVKKCFHATACQKTKPSFMWDVSYQNVSKCFKPYQKYIFLILREPWRSYPTRSKSVKACQKPEMTENTVFFKSVKMCPCAKTFRKI